MHETSPQKVIGEEQVFLKKLHKPAWYSIIFSETILIFSRDYYRSLSMSLQFIKGHFLQISESFFLKSYLLNNYSDYCWYQFWHFLGEEIHAIKPLSVGALNFRSLWMSFGNFSPYLNSLELKMFFPGSGTHKLGKFAIVDST